MKHLKSLRPLRDLILGVKELPPARVGLIHTLEATREQEGVVNVRVLKVGPKVEGIKVGDLVMADRFALYNIEWQGEKFVEVKESDIQGVVEK